MSNAFASVLQARPCPVFGRPIHLWGSPIDYGPVLLLMPFGFHLAVDTLPSGYRRGGFRSALAVSGFRLRAPHRLLHTFLSPASEALPPLSDTALLIRAPEGLEPSRPSRCPAHTTRTLSPWVLPPVGDPLVAK